jgi:hypothetical protein
MQFMKMIFRNLVLLLTFMTVHGFAGTNRLVVMTDAHDLDTFKKFADEAKRFEDVAEVLVNVSGLAEKAYYNIPDQGRHPWYEYTSWNSTIYHFFPHKKIAPYIPKDFVEKNRKLIAGKSEYLRKINMQAAFWSYDLRYLPDEFFEQYPDLLGARVDHPRRSHKPAFSMDVDEPETLEIYSQMIEELFKQIPEIGLFIFKVNDAGSGINWAGLQYDTPNGPSEYRFRSTGERIANFLNAYNEGIVRAGGQTVPIFMEPRFQWPQETHEVLSKLPSNVEFYREFVNESVFDAYKNKKDSVNNTVHIKQNFHVNYPIRYIFDPLAILKQLQKINPDKNNTVFLQLSSWYERGGNTVENSVPFFDLVYDFMDKPVYGRIEVLQRLKELCSQWVDDGEGLFETFCDLHDALEYAGLEFSDFTGMHGYVSSRLINRPCLIMPEKLTSEEEGYFLPYVFSLSEERARTDYMDNLDLPVLYRWTRREEIWPYQNKVRIFTSRMHSIAERLESAQGRLQPYLQKSAAGLRAYASMIRTWENFYKMQKLREDNCDKFSGSAHLPPQGSFTWRGDNDLVFMKQALRDEIENTTKLINIIEENPDVIYTADDKKYEDTFVLGPNLIEQLNTKRKLMLEHYTDADMYMTVPLK